jgi:MinD-like ATPase involved in chromosome partitioning or flagellar assembly
VVAVAGAKGSPGCSFLAVALADCLAGQGLRTLLVDADAEERGLLEYFVRARRAGLEWQELPDEGNSDPDGMEFLRQARQGRAAVIVDLGHQLGRLQAELATASDWLVWVVVPDRPGLARADRALARAPLGGTSPGLVFNRLGPGCLRGADRALMDRHGLPVLARFPNLPAAARSVLDGRPAARVRGLHGPLGELARTVHPDAVGRSSAWP